MKITGGIYKGRNILCPKGIIRPAMGRMRESLFAVLKDLRGRSFLDLYAGSGVVGLEAVSRGARPVVFVEKDYGKKRVLERNTAFTGTDIEINIMPVERFIRREKRSFNIIYLDPPFTQPGKAEVIRRLAEKKLLNDTGTLIIHIFKEEVFPDKIGSLLLSERKTYGGSVLLFYAIPLNILR